MKINTNKIFNKSIFILLPLMSACTLTQEMKTADGQAAISVECSGPLTSWQACYEKIGSICGAYGYEVISSTLDGNTIRGNESDKRVIIARCKK